MMCRSSTTTIGSRVGSMTTLGESTGGAFSFRSATAVPLLRAIEPPETDDQEEHRPHDGVEPEQPGVLKGRRRRVRVLLDQVLTDQLDVDVPGLASRMSLIQV